ncbi:AI-2E family transporter [Calothrix sp. CCY 0018]|uniref:AI-2E family transporter n=1 Tax=Calothrix sp. CCY 0018 TaxID=3103864 RepID=UPI0039C5DBBD
MAEGFKLPRWLSFGLAFPLFILNAWVLLGVIKYLQPLVDIVIAAVLLAFVLEYPIGFFQKRGVNRNLATAGVLLLAIVIVVVLGIIVLPLILEQVNELVNILPNWIDSGTQQLQTFQNWAATQQLPINPSGLLPDILEKLSNQVQSLSGRIIGLAFGTIGSVLNILLTVVLTLYMILNGDRVWEGILKWFPSHISKQVSESLSEDFQNYFIGQATLALILATGLTLAFVALRVPLNLLFALVIGFFALFPFGTGIGITLVSLLVGLKNFWLGVEVLTVAIAIDQFNYNFVAPRILSKFTGLNPVWVVISLLVGAKLLGVLGLLIAIPLASFIKSVADSWRDGDFNIVDKKELEESELGVRS